MVSLDDTRGELSNPIFISSSSGTPFTETASSVSSSGTMDLNRALKDLGTNERRNTNARASSSRAKPTPPRTYSVANGKRRMDDETLFTGIDFATQRKKVRHQPKSSSQTTLAAFVLTSPGSKTRVRGETRPIPPSRADTSALSRNTASTATTRSRPPSQNNQPSSSKSRRMLGGGSAEDPIPIESDDSLPRASHASSEPVLTRRSRSRQPSGPAPVTPGKSQRKVANGSLSHNPRQPQPIRLDLDDDDDDDIVEVVDEAPPNFNHIRSRGSVTASPQKPFVNRRILVPETVASSSRAHILVDETAPPSSRNARSTSTMVASQTSVVPDTAKSPTPCFTVDSDDRGEASVRHSSRARSAETPEARQERQRRANRKALTPAPTPPLPSILEGLGKTPTPKKPKDVPKMAQRDLNSATKRRLFAAPNPDDESYRPNPGTALARPVKASKVAAFQASRPRRSMPEQGKYTLPSVDTPIEQWPTRPGTTHKPQTSKKQGERTSRTPTVSEPKAAAPPPAPASPERQRSLLSKPPTPAASSAAKPIARQPEPSTPKRQRSRSVSSCLTPLPPTQLPIRNSIDSPGTRAPLTPPGPSVFVNEPSPSDAQPQNIERSPFATELPELAKGSIASETETDEAGSEYEMDMYADFAQFAGSPSASSLHNTPSKRSQQRLSLSPVALKALKSPSAARLGQPNGTSAMANGSGLPSPHPLGSQQQKTPSKLSQPRQSVTARVLAEDQERQRKAMEDGKRAAEAREARQREHLKLLEGSDEEDEEVPRLSQVLRDLETSDPPSPAVTRATRRRSSKSIDDEPMPQLPMSKPNAKHAKLFKELERDVKRGVTSAQIEAALSASTSPERRPGLDLANTTGVDEAVIAEVQRFQREEARQVERENVYSLFWEDDTRVSRNKSLLPIDCESNDPAVEMVKEVHDEATLAQLLWYLPVPKSTEAHLNEWLFELAFCASDEELAYVALERLLDCIAHSTEEPVPGPDGLFWLISSSWHQLGARVRESERQLGAVARDRDTASVFICRIAATAASNGWLGSHCAWVILCHLAVLAGDSSTSSGLSRQIAAAAADLFKSAIKDGSHDSMLARELASHPLVPQVRAILALGQRNSATRAAVRWAATGLLLPDTIGKWSGSRPSGELMLHGLESIEDEIRAEGADPEHANFERISNLVALWCAGLTDLDDGWASEPEARILVRNIVRVRDLVRDNADDPATSEVKGRLQLYHHIVNLHIQAAMGRGLRARIAGKGLEMGEREQTRLSFGRSGSEQSGGDGE